MEKCILVGGLQLRNTVKIKKKKIQGTMGNANVMSGSLYREQYYMYILYYIKIGSNDKYMNSSNDSQRHERLKRMISLNLSHNHRFKYIFFFF